MPGVWRTAATRRVGAFHAVAAEPALRRLQLAWGAAYGGEAIAAVAFGVLAYRAAGAGGVALLVAVQMLPAAALAPVLSSWGERHRRERFVVGVDAARALTAAGAAGLAVVGVPRVALFVLASGLTVAGAASTPGRRGLTPLLVRSPSELAAAGVVTSVVQAAAQTVGPLAAGVVFVFAGAPTVLAVAALCLAFGAVMETRLPSTADVAVRPAAREPSRPIRSLSDGVRVVEAEVNLKLAVLLFAAKNLGRGALNVLLVTVALALLGLGSSGVGWFTAAVGAGGVSGGLVAAWLVGRRRLALPMAFGLALWGLPLLGLGARPHLGTAIAGLVIVGIGNTFTDVAGYTLIGRWARDDVLGRVYGLHEAIRAGAICAGAGLAALVVETAGVRYALAATGALLVLCSAAGAVGARRETTFELPDGVLPLLESSPLFGWLTPVGLERLAALVVPLEIGAGDVLLRQGDPGDCAYLLAEGELVADRDGREIGRIEPGSVAGEIALLHGADRMATVRAVGRSRLFRIDRDEFLAAATGNAGSRSAAADLVGERLAAADVASHAPGAAAPG
jgi:Cyclic nucleotide-binding domain/Major Facilitator Superfamily